MRFLAAGAMNTAFGFSVYALLVYLQFSVWTTVSVSLVSGLIFNYFTYGSIAFKNLSWHHVPRFSAFYFSLAALNTALLYKLKELGFGALPSQAILVAPLAMISYVTLNYFIFGKSQTS